MGKYRVCAPGCHDHEGILFKGTCFPFSAKNGKTSYSGKSLCVYTRHSKENTSDLPDGIY